MLWQPHLARFHADALQGLLVFDERSLER